MHELERICWQLDPNNKDLNAEDNVCEFLHGGVMEIPFRK